LSRWQKKLNHKTGKKDRKKEKGIPHFPLHWGKEQCQTIEAVTTFDMTSFGGEEVMR